MVTFGIAAVDLDFITLKQLNEATAIQNRDTWDLVPSHRIGEVLLALGYLTHQQVETVLRHQEYLSLPLAVRMQRMFAETFPQTGPGAPSSKS